MSDLKTQEWYNDKVMCKVTHLDSRYSRSPIVYNLNGFRFQITDGEECVLPRAVANNLMNITYFDRSDPKNVVEKRRYGVFMSEVKAEKTKTKAEQMLGKEV